MNNSTNIGIVGGNSQVATELCILLGKENVKPIVRNQLGAAFLRNNGFDCRIAEVTDAEDSTAALADLDTVVIAAHAPPFGSTRDSNPRRARKTNEAIVENSVKFSPNDINIIYLSSIAAFGEKVFDKRSKESWKGWKHYAREKRHIEEVFLDTTKDYDKSGHVFRLGHVLGPSQRRASKYKTMASGPRQPMLSVARNKPANVVHTVTIAEAIRLCSREGISPQTVTVVNEPQWSWEDVFNYYSPKPNRIKYTRQSENKTRHPKIREMIKTGWSIADPVKKAAIPYLVYLPEFINERIMQENRKRSNIPSAIHNVKDRRTKFTTEFGQPAVPGPFIRGLTKTQALLKRDEKKLAKNFDVSKEVY